MSIRTFVAIELPAEIKEILTARQSRLMREISGIKWVETENLHLTLKFLGDTQEAMVDQIQHALAAGIKNIPPFSLSLGEIGGFPSLLRTRVIWSGLTGELAVLNRLRERVETALEEIGYPREKTKFHPHLTLGRVRSGAPPVDMRPRVNDQEQRGGPWRVANISFMRSELTRRGPIYTTLAEIRLDKSGQI